VVSATGGGEGDDVAGTDGQHRLLILDAAAAGTESRLQSHMCHTVGERWGSGNDVKVKH
jgi:hypothetical protein